MAQQRTGRKIDALLHKEMTRKEFLGTMVTLCAGIMGLSGVMGLFTQNTPPSKSPGYGKQGYGP